MTINIREVRVQEMEEIWRAPGINKETERLEDEDDDDDDDDDDDEDEACVCGSVCTCSVYSCWSISRFLA